MQGRVLLEGQAEHEVHETLGGRALARPRQDTDKLDLAEAGIGSKDGGGRRLFQWYVAVDHFRGGAGRVRDDHRLRAASA